MSLPSKEELEDLIEENELTELFKQLKSHKKIFKGYQDFREEYLYDKPAGRAFHQFKQRLVIFIGQKMNGLASLTINEENTPQDIMTLIDMGKFSKVFEELDQKDIANKFQYNRFKREYQAGLSGVVLMDFVDRLKVFVRGL